MTEPSAIPDEVVVAALELVLKPLGTSLRHYVDFVQANAIEAMRGVLMAERERTTLLSAYSFERLAWSSSATCIRTMDKECLVGIVMTLTGGSGIPSTIRAQIDRVRSKEPA